MSDTDIHFPLYYIVRTSDDNYNLYNRATDAILLNEIALEEVEEFLRENDSSHSFLREAEKRRGHSAYSLIFPDPHTYTFADFDSMFKGIEASFASHPEYEISGYETDEGMMIKSVSPRISAEYNFPPRVNLCEQLTFDFVTSPVHSDKDVHVMTEDERNAMFNEPMFREEYEATFSGDTLKDILADVHARETEVVNPFDSFEDEDIPYLPED
jgi:hypothetical protein